MTTITNPSPSVNIVRSIVGASGVTAAVASGSDSSVMYRTSVQRSGQTSCDCKGHHYRGRCKHVTAVRELLPPAKPAAFDIDAANELIFGFA